MGGGSCLANEEVENDDDESGGIVCPQERKEIQRRWKRREKGANGVYFVHPSHHIPISSLLNSTHFSSSTMETASENQKNVLEPISLW